VEFANLVGKLQRDAHYEIDEKKRTIGILEIGVTKAREKLHQYACSIALLTEKK
jgi:preprotein translocase subunit SecA